MMMFMICFLYPFATEEVPFGAEMFCYLKLSTTCLTLENQSIPSVSGTVFFTASLWLGNPKALEAYSFCSWTLPIPFYNLCGNYCDNK